MNDRELILAINQAIPLRSCPQDRANDISRRAWLLEQVKKYVERQLENHFNAKALS